MFKLFLDYKIMDYLTQIEQECRSVAAEIKSELPNKEILLTKLDLIERTYEMLKVSISPNFSSSSSLMRHISWMKINVKRDDFGASYVDADDFINHDLPRLKDDIKDYLIKIKTISFSISIELKEKFPSLFEKLETAHSFLWSNMPRTDYSEIAYKCRDAIKQFANQIYSPKYLPESEKPLTDQQYKKKLRMLLLHHIKGKEEKKLLESLEKYLDSLVDYINKTAHKATVKNSEAEVCLMYTYLIIENIYRFCLIK